MTRFATEAGRRARECVRTVAFGFGIFLAGASVGSPSAWAQATPPKLIPFQARVTDVGNAPLNGVYGVTFTIYDAATGGTARWVETHPNVSIVAGTVSVFLGSLVSLDDPNGDSNPADAVSFKASSGARFVGIKIGAGAEMVPRHQLVPAFHARVADATTDGAIQTPMLADGSVTNSKLDVNAGVPVGGVVFWWGALTGIPAGFEVCDGAAASTPGATLQGLKPDLRDRFPKGATSSAADVSQNPVTLDNNSWGPVDTGYTSLSLANLPAIVLPLTGASTPSGGSHAHSPATELCATDEGGDGPYYALGDSNAFAGCPPNGLTNGNHFHNVVGGAALNGAGVGHNHSVPVADNRPSFLELFCIIRVK